ncbi:hypothetical protein ACI79G_01160 [Geodermatophilus sp. SYSU D00779]
MLSDHEQRVWDDVERSWAEEAEEPPRPAPLPRRRAPRDPADLPAPVVAGAWGAILLVLFGALTAGLAVGVSTALGWALWRYWPRPGRTDPTTTRSVLREVDRGLQAARRPAEQRRPRQQRGGSPDR